MSEIRIEADEFEDQNPGGDLTIAMMNGEPVVVCWRERDVDAALVAAYDMGLPVASTWSIVAALGFYPGCQEGWAEELDMVGPGGSGPVKRPVGGPQEPREGLHRVSGGL